MIVDVPGIPLRRADKSIEYALVDEGDFVALNDFHWSINGNGYVVRHVGIASSSSRRTVYMHRFLMGLEQGDPGIVDHRNRDRLDNRRSNLRLGTSALNSQNRGHAGGSSQFRGVSWNKGLGKWVARAAVGGRAHYLGSFTDEAEASIVVAAFRAEHMPFSEEAAAA